MSELQDDFRATAENIAQDAQDIKRIEDEKAELDQADPRVDQLSAQVEEIAEQLYQKTKAERDLANTADETS
jgi:hypothetical protein